MELPRRRSQSFRATHLRAGRSSPTACGVRSTRKLLAAVAPLWRLRPERPPVAECSRQYVSHDRLSNYGLLAATLASIRHGVTRITLWSRSGAASQWNGLSHFLTAFRSARYIFSTASSLGQAARIFSALSKDMFGDPTRLAYGSPCGSPLEMRREE